MRTRIIVGSENGSRRGAMCHWQACLLLLVGGMVGCVEGRESQHELDHVIPAHWPTSAQDAANKIDERLKAMADVAASSNESSIPATQLAEIVGWLRKCWPTPVCPKAVGIASMKCVRRSTRTKNAHHRSIKACSQLGE